MTLPAPVLAALRAAADRLIPRDDFPAAWAGGAGPYLLRESDGDLAGAAGILAGFAAELDRRARQAGRPGFAELPEADMDRLLEALFAEPATAAAAGLVLRVVQEGYYAYAREGTPGGWDMLGFRPVPPGVRPAEVSPVVPIRAAQLRSRYDTVIVGGGAGGGVLAGVLAEAGEQVLLIERAAALSNDQLRGDHLHGKRLARYDVTAGPGPGHPRAIDTGDGSPLVLECYQNAGLWGLNAMCLGGGTRLWQGMAWRFSPEDFSMASSYGRVPDSTLSDWPFGADTLEPYYWQAEEEIGVSGAPRKRSTRPTPYPMPPRPDDRVRRALGAAADRLGWDWGPIPFAINSVPRNGRAACVACPQCQGHACPVDAKNGTQNTMIPRALTTGNCDVLAPAQAISIEGAASGRATAVRFAAAGPDRTGYGVVRCGRVVVSAGAVETPRLLLASGCSSPWIGRNLHSHGIAIVLAQTPEPVAETVFRGPGHSVATLQFVHSGAAPYGGGVLFDAPAPLPLAATALGPVFGAPAWGAEHKQWMRSQLPRVIGTMAIGQEIPAAGARVDLDPSATDRYGMPAARVNLRTTPATRQVAGFLAERCAEWLMALGSGPPHPLSADPREAAWAEHSAGTCRMGEDPARSATDPLGRLHGSENVYVCDASLHPTNGSVNPALTVMANAFRIGDALTSAS
jgi:choline dehydrogenase-like flavoprotein